MRKSTGRLVGEILLGTIAKGIDKGIKDTIVYKGAPALLELRKISMELELQAEMAELEKGAASK